MPTYKVTDPTTGKVLRLTGDSPPTEQELEQIFSSVSGKSVVPSKNTAFLPRESEVEQMQINRPDSVQRLKEEVMTPYDFKNKPIKSLLKPVVTGMKVVAVPFQRLESGIAGMGLGLQKGSFGEGLNRAKEGLLGQRQQELGDIIRTTGFGGKANEALASTTGFMASIAAPIEMIRKANKSMSAIQKASDKGLMKASKQLIQGADDAVNAMGKNLDDAYLKANAIKANPNQVLDDVAKLPDTVLKYIEGEIGTTIDDVLSDFTVEKARKLKSALGKIKPTSFGKESRGAVENIQDLQVNRAYASIKKSMQEALKNSGMTKDADALIQADEAFTDAIRASNFIKKTIMDSTLGKPTKTGSMALKLAKEGDMSGRVALNILKSAGREANRNIMRAVNELEKFNRAKFAMGLLRRSGQGIVYGGTGGLLGGKIAGALGE